MAVRDTILEVLKRFDLIGVAPVVGGSYASSAWGHPRQTGDIDLSAELRPEHEDAVLQTFEGEFAIGPQEIHWALTSREPGRSFSVTHIKDAFKVDVFVADGSPFERSEFARARRIELLPGVMALVSSPEDTVLQKLRWYELGNRISDRQWNDIVQVIEVQGPAFDRVYFLEWAGRLGVEELAREALAEAKDI